MGCNQSKQSAVKVPKVNKDVEVRRKFQIGLHLTKEEASVQVAFGKTSRKKYETPSAQKEASESPAGRPAGPQDDTEPQDVPVLTELVEWYVDIDHLFLRRSGASVPHFVRVVRWSFGVQLEACGSRLLKQLACHRSDSELF